MGICMNGYEEFKTKPFGGFALLMILSSWGIYIYLIIDMFMNNSFGFLIPPTLLMCSFQGFIIWFSNISERISIVIKTYEKILLTIWKTIYFLSSAMVELIFRRHYLMLWNFIKNMDNFRDYLDGKVEHFKKENEKLCEK